VLDAGGSIPPVEEGEGPMVPDEEPSAPEELDGVAGVGPTSPDEDAGEPLPDEETSEGGGLSGAGKNSPEPSGPGAGPPVGDDEAPEDDADDDEPPAGNVPPPALSPGEVPPGATFPRIRWLLHSVTASAKRSHTEWCKLAPPMPALPPPASPTHGVYV
jgi:hypothetical protein